MKVYIVSTRYFFVSNNTDYAMAVDLDRDLTLFKSRKAAMEMAESIMNEYRNNFDVSEEDISNAMGYFTVVFKFNSGVKHTNGVRYVVSVTEKNVL